MSRTAKDLLTSARDLIEDPKRWTQQATARQIDGIPCASGDPRARSWCAIGALNHVTRAGEYEAMDQAAFLLGEVVEQRYDGAYIATVNDRDGHDAVMRIYEEAIERAA